MSVVAVLGLGLFTRAGPGAHLGLLALPLAAAGLGVALFHVFLEATGKLECPGGLFDFGTAPQQSLGMFLVIFALLLVDALKIPTATAGKQAGLAAALVLGGLLAVGSTTSIPPLPEAPKQPYAKAPDICRPPFRSP